MEPMVGDKLVATDGRVFTVVAVGVMDPYGRPQFKIEPSDNGISLWPHHSFLSSIEMGCCKLERDSVRCSCGKHDIPKGADPQKAHREHFFGPDSPEGPSSALDITAANKGVGISARGTPVALLGPDMWEP